jgi:hypothetical protein
MRSRSTVLMVVLLVLGWTDSGRGQEEIPDDGLVGTIPSPDETYEILMNRAGGSDSLPGPSGGPIEYQGQRLLFYPEGEVILLEGDASTEQAGTELKADRILFRSREGVVEAFGEASVSRGPSELKADSLFYDRQSETVATFGASALSEGQSVTEGLDLKYDLNRRSGRLGAGVTTYVPWILTGDDMEKIGDSTYLVQDGYFTTCDLDVPHYTFRSTDIKLRQEDVIVASPVVLYFSDIPVFYLPWYVEPATRGRHSGFLRPQIGISTLILNSGRERNVRDLGYYYVINDYADAAVSADWYAESRFILRVDSRYNMRHSFRGDLHYESVWNRLDDESSQLIRYSHDHTFSRSTRGSVDVNWSSRRSFLRRNSFDPDEILQRAFRSAANYSTRFGWGSFVAGGDADFRLDSNRTTFRIPDVRLSINQRPLWGRRTRGAAGEGRPLWQILQYSASTSFVATVEQAQVDSLGNALTTIPTDSLGNEIETDRETIRNEQDMSGRFTLSGPLNLFGVLKATPSASYNMSLQNDQLAEDENLGGRGQFSTAVSFSTKFFRVYDSGLGPVRRWRHTVSPSVGFNYSPKANLFGARDTESAREALTDVLTANVSFSQDLDVKVRQGDEREELADDDSGGEESEEEEQEERTRTINLLNVTNTFSYDFVRAREPDQLGWRNLSTRLTTGVGRSFSVSSSFDTELVKQAASRETFNPFIRRVTTDFSVRGGGSQGSFRQRGFDDRRQGRDVVAGRGTDEETAEAAEALEEAELEGQGFGPWSLNLTHSWSRTRSGDNNRQSLGIGASLLPSPHWSLNYRTTYDVTSGSFQGQTLALVRNLHEWQATLGVNIFPAEPQDRVQISFSVFLRDVPDLELPYRVRRE